MVDVASAREIEAAITMALTRKGMGGKVVVRDTVAELHGAGPVVAIDVGEWVEQWALLPPDMQDRRAESAAVRFQLAMADTPIGRGGGPASRGGGVAKALGTLALLAIVGGAGYWLYQNNFFGAPDGGDETEAAASASAKGPETPEQTIARQQRVCEGARARIYAGAAMDVDIGGWVVELWLARHPSQGDLTADARLLELVKDGHITAAADAKLAARKGGQAAVAKVDHPWTAGSKEAVLQLRGDYVTPFMSKDGRADVILFAERITAAVRADYAALYARCDHLEARDWGAWYHGRDDAGAVTALLYAAGGYSQPKAVQLDKIKLEGAAKEGGVLAKLYAGAKRLPRAELEGVARTSGARILRRQVQPAGKGVLGTSMRFPLGGPLRAGIASKEIARQLKL